MIVQVAAVSPRGFDIQALYAALDERRTSEGLTWRGVADALWDESHDLNIQRNDHPISPATISGMSQRGDISCQHALFILRWLDRPAEDFIAQPRPGTAGVPLPSADPAHRLRWNLFALYRALDAARTARGATWGATAERLHCQPGQLTGLRTVKFAIGMRLTMRICQGLRRPSADFIYAADW